MTKRILHIHVRKEYFEQVKKGWKLEEYREIKKYWFKKLLDCEPYDLIYYYKGYTKEKLIFNYDGFNKKKIKHKEFGNKPTQVFAISLRKPY